MLHKRNLRILIVLAYFFTPLKTLATTKEVITLPVPMVLYFRNKEVTSPSDVIMVVTSLPRNEEFKISYDRPLIGQDLYRESTIRTDLEGKILISKDGKKHRLHNYNELIEEEKRSDSKLPAFIANNLIDVPRTSFLPGEKVTPKFHTETKLLISDISFIPNRLFASTEHVELVFEAILISLKPTIYSIEAQGLKENENFIVRYGSNTTNTKEEKITYKPGMFLAIRPDIAEEDGGVTPLSIIAREQAFTIQLPWGKKLLTPDSIVPDTVVKTLESYKLPDL